MKIQFEEDTLVLSEIAELNAANCAAFRDEARAALREGTAFINVDLSRARFLDSSGLGALISLHKTMCARGGGLRILNPTPAAQQILEVSWLNRFIAGILVGGGAPSGTTRPEAIPREPNADGGT